MAVVRKSDSDSREYSYVSLSNGMRCLLVSDCETDFSSAAMSISCGSLNDPSDVQGLSHFLEHMLFLGTETYPEETTYRSFLKSHSGNFNAFTAIEETNFYFTVSHEFLQPALHIFAQFFTVPLFTPSCVEREMNAVDSEHQKNKKSDLSRVSQIVCEMAKNGHPYNHFGTGNLHTLKIDNIRERLIEHYQSRYSANRMALVVYGRESVDTLKSWAESMLSGVRLTNVEIPPMDPAPFDASRLGTITKVVSVMEKRELRLLWVFPPMQKLYRSKPHSYIGHLIGHEGENSILSMLKKHGLSHGISAGLRTNARDFSLFSITVSLTEIGFSAYETVLEVIFSYLAMLRATGPQQWVFDELKLISDLEFRFKSKENVMEYSRTLASSMQKHEPEDVITAMEVITEYNPEGIKELVSVMTADRVIGFLVGRDSLGEDCVKEKWYGTEYKTAEMGGDLIVKLNNAAFADAELRLDYPPKNRFLPTEFVLLEDKGEKEPRIIGDFDGFSVRYMLDTSFGKDSVQAFVYIKCSDGEYWATPLGHVLAKIWLRMLTDYIRETIYLASQAGLFLTISLETLGITITARGFSQHFSDFLEEIAGKLSHFKVKSEDKEKFEEHFAEVARNLNNTKFHQPHTQATSYFSDLISANLSFSTAAQIQSLPLVSFSDMLHFSRKWLTNLRLDWLFIGNLSEPSALSTAQKCSRFLLRTGVSYPISNPEIPPRFAYSFDTSTNCSHFLFETPLFDVTNANSVALSYWESGPETISGKSALLILENLFKEPCFSYLRTKMQLGYIVFQGNQSNRGVLGHYVLVQSHRFPPKKLTEYIDCFIGQIKEKIEHMSDDEFLTHKNSAIATILQKDVSLEKRFQRFQPEMLLSRYDFQRRDRIGESLQSTSKSDVQSVFKSLFFDCERRIDIEIVSESVKNEQNSAIFEHKRRKFEKISELQRRLKIYAADPLTITF